MDNPAAANTNEVAIGSRVSSIFLVVEAVSNDTSTTATPNFYLAVYKNPGNNMVFPDAQGMGTSDTKRFVLHQEMVMMNPVAGGNPRIVFKGVIRIPPRIQRMATGDKLFVQLFIPSTGVKAIACTQCIYKEFR